MIAGSQMLDAADFLLVNRWQRGFPLVPRPFEVVARDTGVTAEEALRRLVRLRAEGIVDRLGPVFRPNTVGSSLLAAMSVEESRLAEVAAFVSRQSGVNHNYEREHRVNLWFVVTGRSRADVDGTLAAIEARTGLEVLRLPLVEEFHIDLGFDLDTGAVQRAVGNPAARRPLTQRENDVVGAIAAGFPLVAAPYAEIARGLCMREDTVLETLRDLLRDGLIRRIGVVVRHRRLGIDANAMAVWDVPDAALGDLGRRMARDPGITLCYGRARALPQWPYNLYCMVHGRSRAATASELERIASRYGLAAYPHAVLFSRQCFAQRAAAYG